MFASPRGGGGCMGRGWFDNSVHCWVRSKLVFCPDAPSVNIRVKSIQGHANICFTSEI